MNYLTWHFGITYIPLCKKVYFTHRIIYHHKIFWKYYKTICYNITSLRWRTHYCSTYSNKTNIVLVIYYNIKSCILCILCFRILVFRKKYRKEAEEAIVWMAFHSFNKFWKNTNECVTLFLQYSNKGELPSL